MKQLAESLRPGQAVSAEQLAQMMLEMDSDHSGEVDFAEFFGWFSKAEDGQVPLATTRTPLVMLPSGS